LRVEVRLEGFEARGNRFGGREFAGDGVRGFQAVAGDADDGRFVRIDAILGDEFLCDACRYAACGFRENAFRFGEELNGVDDLGIRDVFGPAAGIAYLLNSKGAVGGIADGERARDGIGLLRLESANSR
jgi:hypothetical protein